MGRGQVKMELIENEKVRHATYEKRKKGLSKKVQELSTLCGVKVAMITFGPKHANDPKPVEPEIYPPDHDQILESIKKYKSQSPDHCKKRTTGISHYFMERKRKAESELEKQRRAYYKARFPTWQPEFHFLSEAQLRECASFLEEQLALAKHKFNLLSKGLKGNFTYSNPQATCMQQSFTRTSSGDLLQPQPISGIYPREPLPLVNETALDGTKPQLQPLELNIGAHSMTNNQAELQLHLQAPGLNTGTNSMTNIETQWGLNFGIDSMTNAQTQLQQSGLEFGAHFGLKIGSHSRTNVQTQQQQSGLDIGSDSRFNIGSHSINAQLQLQHPRIDIEEHFGLNIGRHSTTNAQTQLQQPGLDIGAHLGLNVGPHSTANAQTQLHQPGLDIRTHLGFNIGRHSMTNSQTQLQQPGLDIGTHSTTNAQIQLQKPGLDIGTYLGLNIGRHSMANSQTQLQQPGLDIGTHSTTNNSCMPLMVMNSNNYDGVGASSSNNDNVVYAPLNSAPMYYDPEMVERMNYLNNMRALQLRNYYGQALQSMPQYTQYPRISPGAAASSQSRASQNGDYGGMTK